MDPALSTSPSKNQAKCVQCGKWREKPWDFTALTKYLYLITSRNNYQNVSKVCLFKIMTGQI